MYIFIALVILGVIALVAEERLNYDYERAESFSYYKKRNYILTKSESAFFLELQKQLPKGYYVFPKIRIADIVETISGVGYRRKLQEITQKHIDFLICDSSFSPVMAIELNGFSHKNTRTIKSDLLKKKVFEKIKLPLEIVQVGEEFSVTIKHILSVHEI